MRVRDRMSAVVIGLAFVLAGLGAPACAETHQPGAVVTAAHRSIVHDAPDVRPPDVRPVAAPVATPHCPAPPSGGPRFVGERPGYPGTPSGLWREAAGGPCGDHRAGAGQTDGPDEFLLGATARADSAAAFVVAPIRYRPPAIGLPPRGTLPTRAPPVTA
ncbi:hypothetical protein [Micromonospora sp. DPT]|uniref:hypothetical protein n=1 Tax=Micromonospora sp. DPT TaxID=3142975 RepID=UPI0032089FE9